MVSVWFGLVWFGFRGSEMEESKSTSRLDAPFSPTHLTALNATTSLNHASLLSPCYPDQKPPLWGDLTETQLKHSLWSTSRWLVLTWTCLLLSRSGAVRRAHSNPQENFSPLEHMEGIKPSWCEPKEKGGSHCTRGALLPVVLRSFPYQPSRDLP